MGHISWQVLGISIIYISLASAAPGGGFLAAGVVKSPISLDNGNVGASFGGYHASAGLGGLLGGGATGGLHAEAGTPYGHSAGAGLGGIVAEGETSGGLYASADSGAGAAAGAAIGGTKTVSGSVGGSYSAAKSSNTYISKTVEYKSSPVVVEEHVHAAPQVQKTYVERTVIPNYVEKTIQVPSYVEKTIRVPTVVEKKVQVAAPPTIIEKTISSPPHEANVAVSGEYGGAIGGGGHVTVVEEARPVVYKHHVKHWSHRKPIFGGLFAGAAIGGGANAGSYGSSYDYGNAGYSADYGRAGYSSAGYGGGAEATYTVNKAASADLINDAFNIPISTLGAVSKLVGGIVGGTSGSLSVSKSISHY